MPSDNTIALVVLAVVLAALYVWVRRGRSFGYQALANRAKTLNRHGLQPVFLLYSTQSVGMYRRSRGSIWDWLNTGYLAYVNDGVLTIEFPWWKKMQQAAAWRPSDAIDMQKVDYTNTRWRKRPGLLIGDRVYAVVGMDVTDPAAVARTLKISGASQTALEDNRNKLLVKFQG